MTLNDSLATRLRSSSVKIESKATAPLNKLGEQIQKTWFESLKMKLEVLVSTGENPAKLINAKRLNEMFYVLDDKRGGLMHPERMPQGRESVVIFDIPRPEATFDLLRATDMKARNFDQEVKSLMKFADQKLQPLLEKEGLQLVAGWHDTVRPNVQHVIRLAVHSPALHDLLDSDARW
jgi:hypothetical protein